MEEDHYSEVFSKKKDTREGVIKAEFDVVLLKKKDIRGDINNVYFVLAEDRGLRECLNSKICGGYDGSSFLRSVKVFEPVQNNWSYTKNINVTCAWVAVVTDMDILEAMMA